MNHPTLPIVFLHAFFSLLFFSCSNPDEELNLTGQVGPAELSLQKVVIALKANKNPEKMLAEKEALESYLSAKLNRVVEVLIPTDSSVVVESFRNGTLDLGYLSSTDAARNLNQNTASILLIHLKNGLPHYQSVWLSLKNKSYQSINELKGAPVAFASRSSTSGYLIPVWDLSNRGLVGAENSLSDFFSLTIYGTGYVSAVEKVLSGEVEAAAVSDYVFLGDNKYLNDSQKSRLQIIQQQGPVPSHTICARSTLSDSDRKILKETLLAMNHDATSLRDQVFNGELMEVDAEEHLRITREAIEVQKVLKP
jgi:phosphonate transport system substrate-binding protein